MEYVAMIVGVWGAWVVLRVIANERERQIRGMHQRGMMMRVEPMSTPEAKK